MYSAERWCSGACAGSSFSAWVLFNRAKLSMYAVDQYAILCVSSLESHRVPDCQRKRMEDTGLAKPRRGNTPTQKKIRLCPLIACILWVVFKVTVNPKIEYLLTFNWFKTFIEFHLFVEPTKDIYKNVRSWFPLTSIVGKKI